MRTTGNAPTAHPSREEWVAYLYGETDARARSSLTAHLGDCADCRGQVEVWRGTMHAMNAWEMPPATHPRRRFSQDGRRWLLLRCWLSRLASAWLG